MAGVLKMVGGKNPMTKPLAKSDLMDIFRLHFSYSHYTTLVFWSRFDFVWRM